MRTCIAFLCLWACTEEIEPEPIRTACQGAGAPLLEIGEGGLRGFEPFVDGDEVPLVSGLVEFELWTQGLHTEEPVSAVVRVATTGPTTDSLANLALQCGDAGRGWAGVRAALPTDAMPGSSVIIEASLTDVDGTSTSATLMGVLTE